jgi:hypothetical protein
VCLSFGQELLDAAASEVGDIHFPALAHGDTMSHEELAIVVAVSPESSK